MPRPDFGALQAQLLRSGLSPRHVRRTITELDEHFDDLVDAAVAKGAGVHAAERQALQVLADVHEIAAVIDARPEMRSFIRPSCGTRFSAMFIRAIILSRLMMAA